MSYLVLARKFRPQTFASIVGQEHVSFALANSIIRDRVPHALLLTGPRGVGKTTSARVFAKALNCLKRPEWTELQKLSEEEAREKVEPCNECTNCVEITRSGSMAVWEIDGASNNSVENVRELIDSLRSLPPPGSRFKIYIIDEVHMLSVAAFNALLKSLEEPPPNTVFVFATTEAHKIPETVISRCQRYDFRRLPANIVIDQLRSIASDEGLDVDDEVFSLLARKANGGMRDAQSMFDRILGFSLKKISRGDAEKILGFIDRELLYRFAAAVRAGEPSRCFLVLSEAFSQSLDLRSFAADFLEFWRNLLLLKLSENSTNDLAAVRDLLQLSDDEFRRFRDCAAEFEAFDAQRLFDLASKTADMALSSGHPRYVFEAGAAKMALLPSLRPLGEILQKLEGKGASSFASAPAFRAESADSRNPKPEVQLNSQVGQRANAPASAPLSEKQVLASEDRLRSEIKAAPQSDSESADESESEGMSDGGALRELHWSEFVPFVLGKSEKILGEILRRVTLRKFSDGELIAEGSNFDVESLRDSGRPQRLRDLLSEYSGIRLWNVSFQEIVFAPAPVAGSGVPGIGALPTKAGSRVEPIRNSSAASPSGSPSSSSASSSALNRSESANEGLVKNSVPTGSLKDQEDQRRIASEQQLNAEARVSPAVKAALSMFEGSSIDRVSILKE